jgi:hypothetical protein
LGQWFYNLYAQNKYSASKWGATGTVDAVAGKQLLVSDEGTFVTDGIIAGDLVSIGSPGGPYATVIYVISETMLFTTVLSDSATYDAGDDFYIDSADGVAITDGLVSSTVDPNTICAIDANGDFITQGVMAGDTLTMTIAGKTGTVAYVRDELIITSALADGDKYAEDEAFTVADGNLIRLTIPAKENLGGFVRHITGKSDLATATLSIYKGSDSTTAVYQQAVGSSLFELEPCLSPGIDEQSIRVELTYTSAASFNLSYEIR